ncbi:MAG: hypothetical protein E7559_02305 [Ruminococcaceae bacterium]|nr:hypothetical protein [Oscillospiraceae bacterium]
MEQGTASGWKYAVSGRHEDFSLHDCRVTGISLKNSTLTLETAGGFLICPGAESNPDPDHALITGKACIVIELFDEPFEYSSVYIYKPSLLEKGADVRHSHTVAELMERVNSGKNELEIVTELYGWQRLRFSGYLWQSRKPYSLETELELRCRGITYCWNDARIYG